MAPNFEKLYDRLVNREEKLALIGLGYVGMPIAVEFAKHINLIIPKSVYCSIKAELTQPTRSAMKQSAKRQSSSHRMRRGSARLSF